VPASVPFRLLIWGGPGSRVTRLELFYDLVFVFAFLNVSTLATAHLTLESLLEALLILALLWWCWTGFAVLGNMVRADQGIMPVVGFGVMAAVLVLALTTETAFHDVPGGLDGPFIFACAYAGVWLILIAAFWATVGPTRVARRRSLLLAAPTLGGVVIIIVGGTAPELLLRPDIAHNLRIICWVAALVLEYSGAILISRTGLQLSSVEHWAERHALIVLIALGESVIGLGVGATNRNGRPLTPSVIVAAVLGIAIIAVLWWLYFDVLAYLAEHVLHGAQGSVRISLARDIYTYLHLPLVSGVIMFAFGLQRLLGAIIGPEEIEGLNLVNLYGGVILFMLALVAIEARASGRVDLVLIVAAALLVILGLVSARISAVSGLTVLTIAAVTLVFVQLAARRDVRRRVRGRMQHERTELEAAVNRQRRRYL
jgi:low temperature requirement protein LtrA